MNVLCLADANSTTRMIWKTKITFSSLQFQIQRFEESANLEKLVFNSFGYSIRSEKKTFGTV